MLKKWLSGLSLGAISVGMAVSVAGCGGNGGNNSPDLVTSYGAPTPVGNGSARAFVRKQGNLVATVGIEMTETALRGLPTLAFGQDHVYTFAPPPGLEATAIQGIALDYTNGHVVGGFGDIPQFRPSFFVIGDAQRQQITANAAVADAPVSAAEVPANHVALHLVVPTEGAIYLDPTLPGYRETPFSTTDYNYNFFNGHMASLQLGAAVTFLNSKQEQAATLELPQAYPHPGSYPSAYRFTFDEPKHLYSFAVEGFVQR